MGLWSKLRFVTTFHSTFELMSPEQIVISGMALSPRPSSVVVFVYVDS